MFFKIFSQTARFSEKKKFIYIKCLLRFSLQFLSETFLILMRSERDITRNVNRSSCKGPVVLVRFEQNLNFLHRFLKKSSNMKFHENLSSGNPAFPWGRTERQPDGLLGT
jgi:hypothetical protein